MLEIKAVSFLHEIPFCLLNFEENGVTILFLPFL